MGEIFETPALAVRSLVVAISGAEVCSELAKHKAGLECTEARSCRLDRGARGKWAEGSASGRESIVVLQAAKNR
jgi:hypothetical protein